MEKLCLENSQIETFFTPGMKKVKLEKKTQKDFDQGTVVIQTPSLTTSTDYGLLISAIFLCRKPAFSK